MEFLLYLTAQNREIYNLIKDKILIQSSTRICRTKEIFGWYDSVEKRLSICVDRIKKHENPVWDINETFLHEVVHYAQSCKTGGSYMVPFGINPSKMSLTKEKRYELNESLKFSGEYARRIEHEALWLENKPNEVKYVIKKYCM